MKLQKKFLYWIFIVTTIFTLFFATILYRIISNNTMNIDLSNSKNDSAYIRDILNNKISQNKFIINQLSTNPIITNILQNNNLNSIGLRELSNSLDFDSLTFYNISTGQKTLYEKKHITSLVFNNINKLIKSTKNTGYILNNYTLNLISYSIVLDNNSKPLGYIFLEKEIYNSKENNHKLDYEFNFNFYTATDDYLIKNNLFQKILNNKNTIYFQESNGLLNNFSTFLDLYDNIIVLQTISYKNHFQELKNKVVFIFIIAFIFSIIISSTIMILLKKLVISPLNNLIYSINYIKENRTFPVEKYIDLIEEKNEISYLTEEIKRMSDSLIRFSDTLKSLIQNKLNDLENTNEQVQILNKILENTSDGIIITDINSNILKTNQSFAKMNGYTMDELIGKTPRILKSGKHDNIFYEDFWSRLKNYGTWSGEIWNKKKNGDIYAKWMKVMTIYDKDFKPQFYTAISTDLSKLKSAENMIDFMAQYDTLTALPNKTLFIEKLNQNIHFNKKYNDEIAIIFIDLDRFKNINDSFGHEYGDEYLVKIARKMTENTKATDTICRVGGDEFLILLDKFDHIDEVSRFSQNILDLINTKFIVGNKEIINSASAGVSIFPKDGTKAEDLIRKAEQAMYLAKELGKNRYKFYSKELEQQVMNRMELEMELHHALEKKEFELFFQPQVNIKKYLNGEPSIVGCEALIRWRKADGKLIYPDSFIPIAEETGIIIPIGKWVLEEACLVAKEWENKGYNIRMSVNVASLQFEDSNFIIYLDEALKKSNLTPNKLHLELTESMLLKNVKETLRILESIKNKNILYSIDDFGTGYSSLSYIKDLNADFLKIDKSFTFKLNKSQEDNALVKTIIDIGKTFKMNSIAEGVETLEHLYTLSNMDCEEIQGYYISKPICKTDFEIFLEDFRK